MDYSDICVISCYFNPCGYSSRRKNFVTFSNKLVEQGVPFFFIEMAAPNVPFEFSDYAGFTGVRCDSILWQKERLLNALIEQLPAMYSKVCWLDCDILFENNDWLRTVSEALNTCSVIQPYSEAVLLPPDSVKYEAKREIFTSFCEVMGSAAGDLYSGRFARHGHTGFGWAGRREWITDCGLYDACLSGSGDHLMAHAFLGDWRSPCIERIFGEATSYRRHYQKWAERVFGHVQGKISAVSGRIFHLWHGEHASRRYVMRDRELAELNFNPAADLILTESGCWAFSGRNALLASWGKQYFADREEDTPMRQRNRSQAPSPAG